MKFKQGGRQEGREGHWWGLGNPKWGGSGCGSSKDVVKSGKYKTYTEWRLTGEKKGGGGGRMGRGKEKEEGKGRGG
jgi:hypothetical protein